jgi:hypothetical protein
MEWAPAAGRPTPGRPAAGRGAPGRKPVPGLTPTLPTSKDPAP